MMHARARRRTAFTLIELLVVIGIIGVLASLLAAAVMKTVQVQNRTNTVLLIQKWRSLLRQQWLATIDDASTETIPAAAFNSIMSNLAGNDPNLARVIWIKMRLKQQFPVSYAEAAAGVPGYLNAEPAYLTILGGKTAANNPNTESGACLLMALTARSRRGVTVSADYFTALDKRDTDGDGIPELIDQFGNSLVFYRWPMPAAGDPNFTLLNSWDPTYTTEPFHDPQDPTGMLQSTLCSPAFAGVCHPLASPYPQLYLMPVIVSAGMDGVLGLNMPTAANPMGVVSQSAVVDNIYSAPQ